MPTEIYSSTTDWIKQAESQIETYPSGLVKTTEIYIYPGITTSSPSVSGNVYPDPVLEYTENGFTRAVVYIYSRKMTGGGMVDQGDGTSAGQGQYSGGKTFYSKIIKTGTAVRDTVKVKEVSVEDGVIQVPYPFRESFAFTYLASKTVRHLALPVNDNYPITVPTGGEVQIIQAPFNEEPYGIVNLISDFQQTEYGNLKEIIYSYEASCKLYQFINNTSFQDFPPLPP